MMISIHPSIAQSQLINEMTNAVTELTGSFLDNPYHHSNTITVSNLTIDFKKTINETYTQASCSSHPQASSDLPYLNNMKLVLDCLDFVTANIAGYVRNGIDASEWDAIFNPIMTAFGWVWKVIYSTDDVVFYEYSKDNFKMVLAKNIRPRKDYGDYNSNTFLCYTMLSDNETPYMFKGRVVFGGFYQFVEYGDDETLFTKITKVTSKRGIDF